MAEVDFSEVMYSHSLSLSLTLFKPIHPFLSLPFFTLCLSLHLSFFLSNQHYLSVSFIPFQNGMMVAGSREAFYASV